MNFSKRIFIEIIVFTSTLVFIFILGIKIFFNTKYKNGSPAEDYPKYIDSTGYVRYGKMNYMFKNSKVEIYNNIIRISEINKKTKMEFPIDTVDELFYTLHLTKTSPY